MSDAVKPALTPEEWSRLRPDLATRLAWGNPGTSDPDFCGTPDPFRFTSGGGEYSDSLSVRPERRHALAALALHGQPFGFTRDDLEALRYLAEITIEDEGPPLYGWQSEESRNAQIAAKSVAARIAALLPPEDA